MVGERGAPVTRATALLVVVTSAADATAMATWLRRHLEPDELVVAAGYYPAVAALQRNTRAVVVNVGVPTGRDDWRLAELRTRQPGTAIVVVADAASLPRLAATVRADLAVTDVAELPPLRELLVSDEPLATEDQTNSRRSRL